MVSSIALFLGPATTLDQGPDNSSLHLIEELLTFASSLLTSPLSSLRLKSNELKNITMWCGLMESRQEILTVRVEGEHSGIMLKQGDHGRLTLNES